MEKRKSFLRRTAETLDLPGEVLPEMSAVTVTGTHRVAIDRHRGILVYQPERILAATRQGTVSIRGEGLTVQAMSRWEMVLTGNIREITFQEEPLRHTNLSENE